MPNVEHTTLAHLLAAFLRACRAEGKASATLRLYDFDNRRLLDWLAGQNVITLEDLTADHLRGYFLELQRNHNEGGVHGYYRAIRVFLRWIWREYDIDRRNPIHRVRIKAPPVKPLPGVTVDTIRRLVTSCKTEQATRDRAILLALLASGARAGEFTRLNIGDADFSAPSVNVHIWQTKDDEPRTVHLGQRAKQQVMRYLRERFHGHRWDAREPLFATDEDTRFTVNGLRQVIERRAADAGIPAPGLHDFRRGCGTLLRRNGMTIEYIRHYLGHSSADVTRRYLGDENPEVEREYRSTNPVDNIDW